MDKNIMEVDLHLRAFMRNTSGLSSEDMLELSIERMKEALGKAFSTNYKEIRFIHGQGKGLLKTVFMKNWKLI